VRLLTKFEKKGAVPVHAMEEHEALAQDVVEAYGTGDERAFRRVLEHFPIGRPVPRDLPDVSIRIARLRGFVQERLGRTSETDRVPEVLDPADARLLIARAEGFGSWAELVEQTQVTGLEKRYHRR
jgi:hypothetical protein